MYSVKTLLELKGVAVEPVNGYGFSVSFPRGSPRRKVVYEDSFWMRNRNAFDKAVIESCPSEHKELMAVTTLKEGGRDLCSVIERIEKERRIKCFWLSLDVHEVLSCTGTTLPKIGYIAVAFGEYMAKDYAGTPARISGLIGNQLSKLRRICPEGVWKDGVFYTEKQPPEYDYTGVVSDIMKLPPVQVDLLKDRQMYGYQMESICGFACLSTDKGICSLVSNWWMRNMSEEEVTNEQWEELVYWGFDVCEDLMPCLSVVDRQKIEQFVLNMEEKPILEFCSCVAREIEKYKPCSARGAVGQILRMQSNLGLSDGKLRVLE